MFLAPVFVTEMATVENRMSTLRRPIGIWWAIWAVSGLVVVWSIVGMFATDPQGNVQTYAYDINGDLASHTDAEGRMALADTLALAGRARPALIVDFATLTGACVYALTERMSGVFTNRPALHARIEAAGQRSGERVHCFPMPADYDAELESKVADVLQ